MISDQKPRGRRRNHKNARRGSKCYELTNFNRIKRKKSKSSRSRSRPKQQKIHQIRCLDRKLQKSLSSHRSKMQIKILLFFTSFINFYPHAVGRGSLILFKFRLSNNVIKYVIVKRSSEIFGTSFLKNGV